MGGLIAQSTARFIEILAVEFRSGVIKYAARNKRGNALKSREMSSQMDIIAYEGQPLYRTGSQVVVHISQVRCVLEVKKWAHRKEMQGSLKKKVAGLRIDLRASSDRRYILIGSSFSQLICPSSSMRPVTRSVRVSKTSAP